MRIHAHAIDIADFPLDLAYKAACPIVMVVLDDSSSMDIEMITPENNGTFENNLYIFPENPGDNVYSFTSYFQSYMTETERKNWKSQWHGYNSLFYNHKSVYTPWPDISGSGTLPHADTVRPRSNPMNPDATLTLNGTYYTVQIGGDAVSIRNSHYFIVDDQDSDNVADPGENVFLINLSGTTRSSYRFSDSNGNGRVDDNELSHVDMSVIPERLRPFDTPGVDLQNFANWYSFYRKRSLTAKAAMARTITELSDIYLGFYSINKNLIQNALPVRMTQNDGNIADRTSDLLSRLYGLKSKGGTPLREGLDAVGKYFEGSNPEGLGPSPFAAAADGGACQRVYALAMTDGYWTETHFSLSRPDPDRDGYSNTLADVAFTYFCKDLNPQLADLLFPVECDPDRRQHMITFTISFGVPGTLNPADYDPCSLQSSSGSLPVWPNPYCNECKSKIDDLWHASANTHGSFFSAANPETLVASLKKIFENIQDHQTTSSPVTVLSDFFLSSTTFYQSIYNSSGWIGDVEAHTLNYAPGSTTITVNPQTLWSAADKIRQRSAQNRNIISYNGSSGIGFQWNELSDIQKNQLNQDQELISYIRGESFDRFRKRKSILGDIVHSSPVVIGKHVYAGANDGMLHVFSTTDGEEAFAYIPNLVFPNLRHLSDKLYTHRFYVDQTPVYSRIFISGQPKTWLVGGLGKGGKGYYCLDITDVDTMNSPNENTLIQLVKWEFKDDADLGYTFSEPVIVRTKSKTHEYVVIFGNGYNSTNGSAHLYVLDALTGTVLCNLDTGIAGDNGLSSPIVTDVNNDNRADYVYAGDLKGNLWKWDIRGEDFLTWNFSFRSSTGSPAPLFKTAGNQPITSRPDVMRHPTQHGYVVCFGTGRLLGVSDLNTSNTQALYGIWDYGDDTEEYLGEFDPLTRRLSNQQGTDVRLVQQSIDCNGTSNNLPYRTGTQNPVNYASTLDTSDHHRGLPNVSRDAGWYLNLPSTERVHQNVRIWNNVLIALGRTPAVEPCTGGGYTMLYYLNPATGSMVENAVAIAPNTPVQIPVIIMTPAGDKMLFDKNLPIPSSPENGITSGIFFWRQLF